MQAADSKSRRHLELILRQVDSLPTLSSVATKLLSLTAANETHARQVVEAVESDPALTSKVLALCRRAPMAVQNEVVTIKKAVVLLGFNAIRNAVLSLKILEVFAPSSSDDADSGSDGQDSPSRRFDRVGFWQHSLAVAIMAELLASDAKLGAEAPPDEAFVCGLLHDIGKLALDHVLPKSLERVVELTDLNQGNISEFERRIVGLDHHTIGKRLAEQWQLPHRIQDCIWLHGAPFDSLPDVPHRRLIGLVGLADLVVRQHHIGYSGNHQLGQDAQQVAKSMDLKLDHLADLMPRVYEELEQRSALLGLEVAPSLDVCMASIQQANEALGRVNSALERRGRKVSSQSKMLDAVTQFHATAVTGGGVEGVLHRVAASAATVLGAGFYSLLHQIDDGSGADRQWLIDQFDGESKLLRSELVSPPAPCPDLRALDAHEPALGEFVGVLPWIMDHLIDAPDIRHVRLLPLPCAWGTSAVLMHDRHPAPSTRQVAVLTSTWGAAIAAALQHDGARRLGEDLADANIALADARERMLRSESMARLGEMAAGAAHEMNNPLAVISGRAQLLKVSLKARSKEYQAAETIVAQAERLTNLITSLKLFADPPVPQRWPTDVGAMLQQSIDRVRTKLPEQEVKLLGSLQVHNDVLPALALDAEQVGEAVTELLLNALQAKPQTMVSISARLDMAEHRLLITVCDDGVGMDAHTLAHAFDPFFSVRPAGRGVGMGLTRARQYAAGHNGGIELRGSAQHGTTATLIIGLDPLDATADRGCGRSRRDAGSDQGLQLIGGAGESSGASVSHQNVGADSPVGAEQTISSTPGRPRAPGAAGLGRSDPRPAHGAA